MTSKYELDYSDLMTKENLVLLFIDATQKLVNATEQTRRYAAAADRAMAIAKKAEHYTARALELLDLYAKKQARLLLANRLLRDSAAAMQETYDHLSAGTNKRVDAIMKGGLVSPLELQQEIARRKLAHET